MSVLALRGLTKRYPGTKYAAVNDLSLQVGEGEVLALVGESGCGKTTLLRMIAGLETPTGGEVEIGGLIVHGNGRLVPPERRGVGLVFQDYALFPHLNVAQNVAFGLAKLPKGERKERARQVLALVGLDNKAECYPHELSGGQQQRVALARALAPEPTIVLLDEPFSNLDSALKARLRHELGEIIRRTGTTAVFVLHDSDDALALGDRIAIMRNGTIWQDGTPQMVYACPRDGYVARIFGETNLLPAYRTPRGFTTPIGFHPSPVVNSEIGTVTIALYPDELEVTNTKEEGAPATVIQSIFRGSHQHLAVRIGEDTEMPHQVVVYLDGCWPINAGAEIGIRIRPTAAIRVLAETATGHLS
jgi:iron(III) transport system ATP-binding protein